MADTHLGPSRPRRRLPDRVYELLDGVDVVLHAGDVTAPETLHELAGFAPVHAVLGNNDIELRLPERTVVDLDGVAVAMVHDSGPSTGRAHRLRSWFPTADVVVFGHSHLPWHEVDVGADGHRQLHLNPGSPTERRLAPTCTVALLDLAAGRVRSAELVDV
ncbi:MAG: metallophosphoesterase family protein [Acidimicrobiia bacterium]|nr:metallophosphoesterase family protein [Acidimicrobiia bacterium]